MRVSTPHGTGAQMCVDHEAAFTHTLIYWPPIA